MNIIKDSRKIYLTPRGASQLKNGSYKSNLEFSLPKLIIDEPYIIYNTVSLCDAQIPYSFYIINVYNNVLDLSIGPPIIIEQGNYNANTLLKAINSKLPSGMNITFNNATGRMTLSYNQPFQINKATTLYEVLGLENRDYVSTNNQISSSYPMNLLGSKSLKVVIPNLILSNYNTETQDYSTLATIAINVEPYGIIMYSNFTNSTHIIKNKTIDFLEIKIYDDDGNLIDFQNIEWSITLEINSYIVQNYDPTTIDKYFKE